MWPHRKPATIVAALGALVASAIIASAITLTGPQTGVSSMDQRNRVISGFSVNSFGDNGWSFTKGSAPLVCFSITPNGSRLLRSLLRKGPVKVRANVDSRYYAGI